MIIRADDFDHEYMKLTGLRRQQKKLRGNPAQSADTETRLQPLILKLPRFREHSKR